MAASARTSTLSLATLPSLHASIFGGEDGDLADSLMFSESVFNDSLFHNSNIFGEVSNSSAIPASVVVPRITSFTQFSNQASTLFQPQKDSILQGAGTTVTPQQQQQQRPSLQSQQQHMQAQPQQQQKHTPTPYPPLPPPPPSNAHRYSVPLPQPINGDTLHSHQQRQQHNTHRYSQPVYPNQSLLQEQLSQQRVLAHRASIATMMSTATTNTQASAFTAQTSDFSKPLPAQPLRGNTARTRRLSKADFDPIKAQREALKQQLKQQQKMQQKKTLPLFPTERTRGASSIQNALRAVDLAQIDLMPIEFSHKIVMKCIDEIKLRGYFFFELLSMLPELNRFLFVEILELCCDLVDNQMYNQISHSKLSIYPGSCCFGLDEFMPTWDTRYLLNTDVKKFSGVFYHVLYAYREERDLSAEALQEKLDTRTRTLEKERLDALESKFGLEGTFAILRMEARVAKGLPAESPVLEPTPPTNTKEIFVYADRKEKVVADDAISILDIHLDEEGRQQNRSSMVLERVDEFLDEDEEEEEEETIEVIRADLRRSVSVMTLVYSSGSNSTIHSAASSSSTIASTKSFSNNNSAPVMPVNPIKANNYYLYNYNNKNVPNPAGTTKAARPTVARLKSIARFSTIENNMHHPVSPGDIFGISRHAIERKELQEFMSVVRTTNKPCRKSPSGKRLLQLRIQHKLLRNSLPGPQQPHHHHQHQHQQYFDRSGGCFSHHRKQRFHHHHHSTQNHAHWNRHQALFQQTHLEQAKTPSQRRSRTRQLRKALQIYIDRGLSHEEALVEKKAKDRKQRRREKKAQQAAIEAESCIRQLEMARVAAEEVQRLKAEITMEEEEVMEAFDYLTDQEFEEFLMLAGLTMADVDRIREKAAAAALNKVTKDIASFERRASVEETQQEAKAMDTEEQKKEVAQIHNNMAIADVPIKESPAAPLPASAPVSSVLSFEKDGQDEVKDAITPARKSRPTSLPKMTSMDLLMKHAKVIGDSNLRCYPELVTGTTLIAPTAVSTEATPTPILSPVSVPESVLESVVAPKPDLSTVVEEDITFTATTTATMIISSSIPFPKTVSTKTEANAATTTVVERNVVSTPIAEQTKKVSTPQQHSSIPVPTSRIPRPTSMYLSPEPQKNKPLSRPSSPLSSAGKTSTTLSPVSSPQRVNTPELENKRPSSPSSPRFTETIIIEKTTIVASTSTPLVSKNTRLTMSPSLSSTPEPVRSKTASTTPSPSSRATETTARSKFETTPESKQNHVRDAIKSPEPPQQEQKKKSVRDTVRAFETTPSTKTTGAGSKLASIPSSVVKSRLATLPGPTSTTTAAKLKENAKPAMTTVAITPISSLKSSKNQGAKKTTPSTSSASIPAARKEIKKPNSSHQAQTSAPPPPTPKKDSFNSFSSKVNNTTIKVTNKPLPPQPQPQRQPSSTASHSLMPPPIQNVLEVQIEVEEVTLKSLPVPVPAESLQILHVQEEEQVVIEDEDAAELRELLESMSEEERSEFLRLSGHEVSLKGLMTPAAIATGSV
ncbi:hypothetical protein BGZ83_004238 [Gryganskiella cystojenkinii]|nr:hypothetical protein BGZ83_004238 [Gryganskiella cystojenkinii]